MQWEASIIFSTMYGKLYFLAEQPFSIIAEDPLILEKEHQNIRSVNIEGKVDEVQTVREGTHINPNIED